jgi:hypothetical protein
MAWPGLIAATILGAARAAGAPAAPLPPEAIVRPAEDLPAARTLFPGVRADLQAGVVEVDAEASPMLVRDEAAPLFFLEVLACTPDTREHETLLVVRAKPSHVHAALLAVGLKPGKPGAWTFENDKLGSTPPSGDRVDVRFVYTAADGRRVEVNPLGWVVGAKDSTSFLAAERTAAAKAGLPAPGWVFAGSVMVKRKDPGGAEREVYDADGSGVLLGLTTFGSEVIAWSRVISPEASVQEPEWVAAQPRIPPAGTKVAIRIRRAAP